MSTLQQRRERIEIEEEVNIPALDGTGVAETITVKVPAWRDPKDGEVYLDGEGLRLLDRAKARHMGLLSAEQIKKLRERLGLKQKPLSELLQIGEKTWTRWETGRERPSRSINVLLCALYDGRIDVAYLKNLARRRINWVEKTEPLAKSFRDAWIHALQSHSHAWSAIEFKCFSDLSAALIELPSTAEQQVLLQVLSAPERQQDFPGFLNYYVASHAQAGQTHDYWNALMRAVEDQPKDTPAIAVLPKSRRQPETSEPTPTRRYTLTDIHLVS